MMAHHGLELTFVFDITSRVPEPTGSSPQAPALAETIAPPGRRSRTRVPSNPKLGTWPACDAARTTMVFDNESTVVKDPHGGERHLWATVIGYPS